MQIEPTTQPAVQPTGCCPPFDPAPWQNQEITWDGKPFVKDHVTCLFHVPLNMGRVVIKDMALIDAAGAAPDHQLILSDELSPWGADLFIEVNKLVPGATMAEISGNVSHEGLRRSPSGGSSHATSAR
jgi:hypothetical protein